MGLQPVNAISEANIALATARTVLRCVDDIVHLHVFMKHVMCTQVHCIYLLLEADIDVLEVQCWMAGFLMMF